MPLLFGVWHVHKYLVNLVWRRYFPLLADLLSYLSGEQAIPMHPPRASCPGHTRVGQGPCEGDFFRTRLRCLLPT